MKIGYLLQAGVPDIRRNPYSGPAVHVRRIIEELKKLGHQVQLLIYLDKIIWQSENLVDFVPVAVPWLDHGPLRLLESGVRRIQYELRLPYAGFFESYRFALACRSVFNGYDLLYERMGWMGYGGGLAAHWLKIPLILEVNGDHLDEMEILGIAPKGMQRLISLILTHQAFQAASHIVATGEGWRNRLLERWDIGTKKVTIIENGTELVDILNREQLCSFQDSMWGGTITLAFIGGFEPWQGLPILAQALARLIDGGVQIRLIIIGSGPGQEEIQQQLRNLNIQDYVVFTGRLSPREYAGYLASADIGISPYCGRVEFSGLKLLDYKAAGLAVIASGNQDQPAVIKHGKTGWIVPPCDVDALVKAVAHLSSNAEIRRGIGREARIEAEYSHSWRHTAFRINQIIMDLTKQ